MEKLLSVEYGGKTYPVSFKQTPNWSHTGMKKKGLVWHVTTSNSYEGSLAWLTDPKSQVSILFLVGREVGKIVQFGYVNQRFWHAGNVRKPSERFLKIAVKGDMNGAQNYVNPNLYLDGVEFSGGVDANKNNKVEAEEVSLTEWQYHVATQIAQWHAKVCGYELTPDTQIMHQDVADYKEDLTYTLDEIKFRLFKKDKEEKKEQGELQKETVKTETVWSLLVKIINLIFKK